MINVCKIEPEGFGANSYLLFSEGRDAVAIDPASPRVKEEAEARGLFVSSVLLTHGHFDHTGGCAALQAAGAKIGCLAGEETVALHGDLAELFGFPPVPPFRIDFTLRDGEERALAGIKIRVLATPGHTAHGACYLCEEGRLLFTGDTLFCGSVGRTDLPGGSALALGKSLKILSALSGDYRIYAGHGEDTTLLREKTYNGWLKC